jgi:hypothetical protein
MKKKGKRNVIRISVTFPSEYYSEIAKIATQRKVSVAWVVRDAVEKYLTARSPLFPPAVSADTRESMNAERVVR